jgi:hypothetical protein
MGLKLSASSFVLTAFYHICKLLEYILLYAEIDGVVSYFHGFFAWPNCSGT